MKISNITNTKLTMVTPKINKNGTPAYMTGVGPLFTFEQNSNTKPIKLLKSIKSTLSKVFHT